MEGTDSDEDFRPDRYHQERKEKRARQDEARLKMWEVEPVSRRTFRRRRDAEACAARRNAVHMDGMKERYYVAAYGLHRGGQHKSFVVYHKGTVVEPPATAVEVRGPITVTGSAATLPEFNAGSVRDVQWGDAAKYLERDGYDRGGEGTEVASWDTIFDVPDPGTLSGDSCGSAEWFAVDRPDQFTPPHVARRQSEEAAKRAHAAVMGLVTKGVARPRKKRRRITPLAVARRKAHEAVELKLETSAAQRMEEAAVEEVGTGKQLPRTKQTARFCTPGAAPRMEVDYAKKRQRAAAAYQASRPRTRAVTQEEEEEADGEEDLDSDTDSDATQPYSDADDVPVEADAEVCPPRPGSQGDWQGTATSRLANMYRHVGTSDATRLSTPVAAAAANEVVAEGEDGEDASADQGPGASTMHQDRSVYRFADQMGWALSESILRHGIYLPGSPGYHARQRQEGLR